MVTAVISDLHLGTRTEADLLRRPEVREKLMTELEAVDHVVLLGDTIELRDGRPSEALEAAVPFFEDLGEALSGRRVTVVAGNHDYQLASRVVDAPPCGGSSGCARARASLRPAARRSARAAGAAHGRDRGRTRVSGPVAACGRLRHPRPLPRLPQPGCDVRVPRSASHREAAPRASERLPDARRLRSRTPAALPGHLSRRSVSEGEGVGAQREGDGEVGGGSGRLSRTAPAARPARDGAGRGTSDDRGALRHLRPPPPAGPGRGR